MSTTEFYRVSLYSSHNGSNKDYVVTVTKPNNEFIVAAAWGPSGSLSQSHTKGIFQDLNQAIRKAETLVASKKTGDSKYQEISRTSQPATGQSVSAQNGVVQPTPPKPKKVKTPIEVKFKADFAQKGSWF